MRRAEVRRSVVRDARPSARDDEAREGVRRLLRGLGSVVPGVISSVVVGRATSSSFEASSDRRLVAPVAAVEVQRLEGSEGEDVGDGSRARAGATERAGRSELELLEGRKRIAQLGDPLGGHGRRVHAELFEVDAAAEEARDRPGVAARVARVHVAVADPDLDLDSGGQEATEPRARDGVAGDPEPGWDKGALMSPSTSESLGDDVSSEEASIFGHLEER